LLKVLIGEERSLTRILAKAEIITSGSGRATYRLAQTLKRLSKGLDLKGNAFNLAFSPSGIGRMRTVTLPGAESGMRSTILRYISGRFGTEQTAQLPPLTAATVAEDRCNLAAVPIAPKGCGAFA
jgi:hypothetical protein